MDFLNYIRQELATRGPYLLKFVSKFLLEGLLKQICQKLASKEPSEEDLPKISH